MKLVITTKREKNYRAGFSDSELHWKDMDYGVYVVRNLTWEQVERIEEKGIPTLTSLIEVSEPTLREFIVNVSIVENDGYEGDTPIELTYDRVNRFWCAKRSTWLANDWDDAVEHLVERWALAPGGKKVRGYYKFFDQTA